MRASRTTIALCACLLASSAASAGEPSVERDPGLGELRVFETRSATVYVPADHAARLADTAAMADAVYRHLTRESGVRSRYRPVLWFAEDADFLNGWSSPMPRPVVQVGLTPALPSSEVFFGGDYARTVLVHELAHHFTNEANHGARRGLERLFGRIVPNDPLSAIAWYLSAPPHISMPSFWHEGVAQWAETTYADPASPWSGRGRNSLTHMIWRMAVAADELPPASDWRLTYPRWPYGTASYAYGLAYVRYLAAVYSDAGDVWRLAASQARQRPFEFDGGLVPLLGKTHGELIEEARAALFDEQRRAIETIEAEPVTRLERLTPPGFSLGAPAWRGDRLAVSAWDPYGRPSLIEIDSKGRARRLTREAHGQGDARRSPAGAIVYTSIRLTGDENLRRRVAILRADGRLELHGYRLVHPDLWDVGPDELLAAVQFTGGGGQSLRVFRLESGRLVPFAHVHAEGRPWYPVFRPSGSESPGEMLWVETHERGSRLVLAPFGRWEERTVLLELPARILHPCFDPSGQTVFFSSDVSGVANGYALSLDGDGDARPRPVTNVVGGVTAIVPSPDGTELALLDHDHQGPFLARLPNDPALWPGRVPEVTLAWPAPVAERAATPVAPDGPNAFRPLPSADPGSAARLIPYPYQGLRRMEFLFWAPTTFAVPEGGDGVMAAFGDPTLDNLLVLCYGRGFIEGESVWQVEFLNRAPSRTEVAASASRSEVTYFGQVLAGGFAYDYTETRLDAALSARANLSSLERGAYVSLAAGVSDADPVAASVARFGGLSAIVSAPPFTGTERYVEAGIGYDGTTFFPTSYSPEDGARLDLICRYSGFGGDLERARALARGAWTISHLPRQGHQLVARGALGWSEASDYLQSAFVGGGSGRSDQSAGLPRGYGGVTATGRYLSAWSGAYRMPLYRPFKGVGTSPLEFRQLFVELFYDEARVSDASFASEPRFRSVGAELTLNASFWTAHVNPTIRVARQLDGPLETSVTFLIGVGF